MQYKTFSMKLLHWFQRLIQSLFIWIRMIFFFLFVELETKRILLDIFKERQQKNAEAGSIPCFYKKAGWRVVLLVIHFVIVSPLSSKVLCVLNRWLGVDSAIFKPFTWCILSLPPQSSNTYRYLMREKSFLFSLKVLFLT